MGKKRRILTNLRKFGVKHFEFLDNLDGTNDNVISSNRVATTLRTLNLVDNGDRTIKVSAELFGSGSSIGNLLLFVMATGGADVVTPITSSEKPAVGTPGARGYPYVTSKPALQNAAGNVFVLPAGTAKIKAVMSGSSAITLTETVTVGAAPIGVTSALLSGALSSTGHLRILTTSGLVGTGPQHGSGSGVGSSQVYAIASSVGHGFHIAASGSLTGSLTLANHAGFATTPNGHGSSSVQLLASASVAALASQTLTVTLTPLDVNGAESTTEAISTTLAVPFA